MNTSSLWKAAGIGAMLTLGLGLVGQAAVNTQGRNQQDGDYARPRDLAALQNDLNLLDEVLATAPQRGRRSRQFQQRADAIRQNVTVLADQMREHNEARRQGRVDGRFAGATQIANLRRDVATLRTDLENTQTAQQNARNRRRNNVSVVPAGTEIQVMMDQEISSKSANVQDRVSASTVTAIRLDGRTLIPAGAQVSGVVREVRSRNKGQQDSWLKIDFDRITPEGGAPINIRSQVVSVAEPDEGSDHKVRNSGIGAILGGTLGAILDGKRGAIIGAVVGAGGGLLASRGNDEIELDEGSLLTLRLEGPMNYNTRR